MKNTVFRLLLLLLSALPLCCRAAPATGYWWNPAEGGRGFVIEVQGTSLFVAGFLYDASGRATWVASNGPMTSATQYSGALLSYANGQTLDGTYQAANLLPSPGTIALTFSDNTHATLSWPGGTIPIQRFDFGPGGSAAAQPATNPQTGYWWNPAEGGRGFTIEVQGGTMYLAGYMYDVGGNPLWYLASGAMSSSIFQGQWTQYANGQTLTGAYKTASLSNSDVGPVTVQFSDTSDAVLTLPNGRQIPLTRFTFGTTNSTTQNVAPIIVDQGPVVNGASVNDTNVPFISLTLCATGTSLCQTIDHISVDTGSSGLRVISSVLTPALAAALTQQKDASGRPLVECGQFADGFVWGPVKLADLSIAGEQAKSLPMQVINDPAFLSVPLGCSGSGTNEGTVASFGANGIIGVGSFQSDCGSFCAGSAASTLYYACPATGCVGTAVAVSQQVQNPVGLFTTDNNGVLIQMPAVPAGGQATASGSLIFGIGTQANNALGSATVLPVDPNTGFLNAVYKNQTYFDSFMDSGSSAFFLPKATGLPPCGSSFSPFYCPGSTVVFSIVLHGMNSASTAAAFNVNSAQTLLNAQPSFAAFNNLGAVNSDSGSFDIGFPFFYGRSIFTAIENKTTPGGNGPYVAY